MADTGAGDESREFSYTVTKDEQVFVYRDGKKVTVLRGRAARKFVAEAQGADLSRTQDLLRRVTGNYKRGNERSGGKRRR